MTVTSRNAFRLAAAATAATVLTGLLTGSIDLPEAPFEGPADVPFVRGLEVDPAVLDRDINQELAGEATANLPAPVWPSSSSARIELATDQRLTVPGSVIALAPIGSDPIASIQVNTLGRSDSDAKGFTSGLVFELTRVDDDGSGEVSAQVDYAAFAYAFGADWRTRLALWTVPGCVGCAPERLDTTNNIAGATVIADVPLAAAETTTLLLAADSKGGAGDYTASKLSPSSTWSQGGNSGSYNWSYPMTVPSPVGAGPLPSLGLSYSSASVDGRSEATNNQPGWIGEGFSFGSGSIERRYVPCANDMDGANNTEKTGDRCWKTDNAILSMEGRGGELVQDDDSGKWRLKNDDGTVIERKTDTDNPDNNNEYWKLTTPDGTQYFFGLNQLPGWTSDKTATESVLTMPVAGNNTDEPCHDSTFGSSFCDQAWKWNLDYVVDVHGNTMSYWYDVDTNRYGKAGKADNPVLYDRAGELVRIDYGTDNRDGTEYGGIVPGRIDFTLTDRCLSDCGTHDEAHWPDTPWDLSCTSTTSCPGSLAPTLWSTKRLTKITTTIWDNGLGKHMPVDSWEMTHTFPNPGDGTRAGLWLDTITRTGHVGGTAAMPPIEFDWVQMYNRVDDSEGCRPSR
ncbi:hypothetical protein Pen01_55830 [Phytomonospora endophytica]|nr:hypothetical protein Pen01_55830 [Phytomonospora endophytica]